MLKLIYFSNPFGITFTLKVTGSSIYFNHNTNITISRTSIFPSDMTMISNFNIILKSSLSFLFITSFLLQCFFITSLQHLLSLTMLSLKLQTASLPKYDLKGLLNLSLAHSNL